MVLCRNGRKWIILFFTNIYSWAKKMKVFIYNFYNGDSIYLSFYHLLNIIQTIKIILKKNLIMPFNTNKSWKLRLYSIRGCGWIIPRFNIYLHIPSLFKFWQIYGTSCICGQVLTIFIQVKQMKERVFTHTQKKKKEQWRKESNTTVEMFRQCFDSIYYFLLSMLNNNKLNN